MNNLIYYKKNKIYYFKLLFNLKKIIKINLNGHSNSDSVELEQRGFVG